MAAEAEPPARPLVHARAGVQPEAGADAPRNAAGRAGAAGPHARRPGFRHARHLSPSRRAAVGGKNPVARTRSSAPIMAGASAATACAAPFPRWWTARIWIPTKIRVRALSRARAGWADLGLCRRQDRERRPNPSRRASPIANPKPRWTEIQTFPCGIDHAVIGLMDPAHAPYVHDHWWWKRTPRLKEKHYAPLAHRLCDDARTSRPSRPTACSAMSRPRSPSSCPPPASRTSRAGCSASPSRWWG